MKALNVLMVGTEYTTGFSQSTSDGSDKKSGVIALTLFDMRKRNRVNKLAMVGSTGRNNAAIRSHVRSQLSVYQGLDLEFDLYPDEGVARDPDSYKSAIDLMSPGDAVTIFTPDDTHFDIALYAIQRGLHVLIAKPAVQTLKHHVILAQAAKEKNVLVVVEFHKRFDPIYSDARERIRRLGGISFFDSYMSQPKYQLETFRSWAGKKSDISYYLNSHHIDFLVWSLEGIATPVLVTASAATGVATQPPFNCVPETEDTITLMVQWENNSGKSMGTSVHTASWIAAPAEVHSQQRFFYLGHKGEVRIDQAHRGYELATDEKGYASVNPLFMRYTPNSFGEYAGQNGYGHVSIEKWVEACTAINSEKVKPEHFAGSLATIHDTVIVTAILEAGRKSLNSGGIPISLKEM